MTRNHAHLLRCAFVATVVWSALTAASLRAAQLEWQPTGDTGVAGYRVYVGELSRSYTSVVDVGNNTAFSLNTLAPGRTFYFAVTAYDAQQGESGFSDEVSYTAAAVGNRPPVSANDGFTISKNSTLSRNFTQGVLLNDFDPDGDSIRAYLVSLPANGTVSLDTLGGFTYQPATDFVGIDSFTYRATDLELDSELATVTINVTNNVVVQTNRTPVAANDAYVTAENVSLVRDAASGVLANDSDPDLDAISAVLVSGPAHGQLTLNAAGDFVYQPANNYVGADSFTYRAFDGALHSVVATVTITVTNVNRAPVAANDQYVIGKNLTLTRDVASGVLANDSDPDAEAVTAVLVSGPAYGQLTLNSAGNFVYQPANNYVGADSFTYRAFDGGLSSANATVTITVTNVNRAPVAANDQYVAGKNLSISRNNASGVLANDSDPDVQALSAVLVSGPAHGQLTLDAGGSFIYQPANNYVGSDSFTYRASDGSLNSAVATVSITITNINRVPTSNGEQYATAKNTKLTINAASGVLANDSDPDGQSITAVIASQPSHGQVTLNASGGFTYTPVNDYVGGDSFGYRVSDGVANSAIATATITITNVPVPNRAPVAVANQYGTFKNVPLQVTATSGVLANDYDPDNNPISAILVSAPVHGEFTFDASGAFAYVPAQDFFGNDSFTYQVSDGALISGVVTVSFVVSNVSVTVSNRAPSALGEQFATAKNTMLNVPAAGGLLSNDADPDGDDIEPVLVSLPAHGSVTIFNDGRFLYMPASGFVGSDSFGYRASDGFAVSDVATVTITVTNAAVSVSNRVPVALGDFYTAQRDNTLYVDAAQGLLVNDHDDDGDTLSAVLVNGPSSGTVTVSSDGSFAFTPTAGFVGTDTFLYRVSDGKSVSGTVAVSVTVNEAPPGSEITCADCLAELNSLVVSESARLARAPVTVTASNSIDEVVRAYAGANKALRGKSVAIDAQLRSVQMCLLTVVSNTVAERKLVVTRMYPSPWSAAASRLIEDLEHTAEAPDLTRGLSAAVKSLKRLDGYIARSLVFPASLENRSMAFALTAATGGRFTISFADGGFVMERADGVVFAGSYGFTQSAWDGGVLTLNFTNSPPATLQLQFRTTGGRVRGPVAKGAFTFVQ